MRGYQSKALQGYHGSVFTATFGVMSLIPQHFTQAAYIMGLTQRCEDRLLLHTLDFRTVYDYFVTRMRENA